MNLKRILAVMKNEFLFLWRDRRTLAAAFLLPLFLLFLLAYAITNTVQPTSWGLYNADGSSISQSFLRTIERNSPFRFVEGENAQQVLSWMKRGKLKGTLLIPPHFSQDLLRGESPRVFFISEGIEPLSTRLYLHSFDVAKTLAPQYMAEEIYFLSSLRGLNAPFEVSYVQLFNPTLDHFAFIIPGLIGCILMSIIPIYAATSVVREREKGSFDRVLASPTSSLEFLMGKLGTYFLIAVFDCLIMAFIGIFYFDVPFRGNEFEYFAVLSLFSLWTASLGLLISTLTENQMAAFTTTMAAAMLPAFIFSGIFYPLDGIPIFIRWISYVIPVRYFVEISREIYLKGNSISFWWKEFLGLFSVTLVTLFFLFYRFKRIAGGPR